MASIAFDTHFFVKKLTGSGLPEKQAEAVIDVIRETKENDLNIVVTKADLRELELRLQNQIQALQIRVGAMIMGLGGILIAIKYFG